MVKGIMKKYLVAIVLSSLVAGAVSGCGSIQAKSLAGSEVLGKTRARTANTASAATMDKTTQDSIAASMSTTETAKALDFDWFIDKVYNISGGDYENVVDATYSDRIGGDEPYLINGGWKCYMCSADEAEIGTYERYLNAVIDTDGKDFKITINWWLFREASLPNGEEFEKGSEVATGKWDAAKGTVHTVASIGNIDFTDFYISKNRDEEFAMGTVTWCSGEVDYIGLMRMTPQKEAEIDEAMIKADQRADNVELIIERAKKRTGAPFADVDWDDDHTITIHLYEVVTEGTEGSHTATWDWYTIDVDTMKGEDFFGNPVDLSK